MTDEAVKKTEEGFVLKREALELLELIVAEWKSDPTSTQCFDSRIIQRAKDAVKKKKQLEGYL